MLRYVFTFFCIGFCAGLWGQESFNIFWIMHTDEHIQKSSPAMLESLKKNQMVEVSATKPENLVELQASDALPDYNAKIESFVKRFPDQGPITFNVMLNSHGSQNGLSTCSLERPGQIAYDSFYQAIAVRLSPEQISRTRINIVVDACHSGGMIRSVQQVIKSNQNMVPSRNAPKVSVISAVDLHDVSYSNHFPSRVDAAAAHLLRIERLARTKGINFCENCTQLQKIGLLLNTYQYSDRLTPSYWSNGNQPVALDGQQLILALETAEPQFFELANLKAATHINAHEPALRQKYQDALKQISLQHDSAAIRQRAQIRYNLSIGDVSSALDSFKQGITNDIFKPNRWEDDAEIIDDSKNANRQRTKQAIHEDYLKSILDQLGKDHKRLADKSWTGQLLLKAGDLLEVDDQNATAIYYFVKAAFDQPHPNQAQLDQFFDRAEKRFQALKSKPKDWGSYYKKHKRNPVGKLSSGVEQLWFIQNYSDDIMKFFGPKGLARLWPANEDSGIHNRLKHFIRMGIAERIIEHPKLSTSEMELITKFLDETTMSSLIPEDRVKIKDWLPKIQLQYLDSRLMNYLIREQGPGFIDELWPDRNENRKKRNKAKQLATTMFEDKEFWQRMTDHDLEELMKHYVYEVKTSTTGQPKSVIGQVLHQFSETVSDDVLQSLLRRHQMIGAQSPFFTTYLADLRRPKPSFLYKYLNTNQAEYEKARKQVSEAVFNGSICDLFSKAKGRSQ